MGTVWPLVVPFVAPALGSTTAGDIVRLVREKERVKERRLGRRKGGKRREVKVVSQEEKRAGSQWQEKKRSGVLGFPLLCRSGKSWEWLSER